MKIQSLSIMTPPRRCANNCVFCCSKMREDNYQDNISLLCASDNRYVSEYRKRLEFARDNGCNTLIITGTSEPQQDMSFLEKFREINESLRSPFKWIEMQTSGTNLGIDRMILPQLSTIGVETISLSVASFNDSINNELLRVPVAYGHRTLKHPTKVLCRMIKGAGFNLRLSLNLTEHFDSMTPAEIMEKVRELNADQVTFRVLYAEGESEQAEWVRNHSASEATIRDIKDFIRSTGRPLETLPFGQVKYSLDGISTVLDDDCMAVTMSDSDTYKYLILREDCRLYSRWEDKGSLIF